MDVLYSIDRLMRDGQTIWLAGSIGHFCRTKRYEKEHDNMDIRYIAWHFKTKKSIELDHETEAQLIHPKERSVIKMC